MDPKLAASSVNSRAEMSSPFLIAGSFGANRTEALLLTKNAALRIHEASQSVRGRHGPNQVEPEAFYRGRSLQSDRHLPEAPSRCRGKQASREACARGGSSRRRGWKVPFYEFRPDDSHRSLPALRALALLPSEAIHNIDKRSSGCGREAAFFCGIVTKPPAGLSCFSYDPVDLELHPT